jgi:hypothetical protein
LFQSPGSGFFSGVEAELVAAPLEADADGSEVDVAELDGSEVDGVVGCEPP